MSRKFNDIVPPKKKRSIRDISVARKDKKTATAESEEETTESETQHTQPKRGQGRRPRTRLPWFARAGVWGFAVLVLLVAGFGFFLLFSGATVTVEPRVESTVINGSFAASREPEPNELPYERMEISKTATRTVSASGNETVDEAASGTIRIYNEYSERDQRFVANTRFESPNGDIYRTREAIVIPGMNGDTPGTIDVTVYADETGDAYNIPEAGARFMIPGLEGTDLYEYMYADSVSAITGGFSGTRPVVADADETQARAALREQLREQLIREASAQVPAEYHLYESGIAFSFTTEPTESMDGAAVVRERAELFAPLIKTSDLARFIARNTIAAYDDGDVTIQNPANLTFTIASTTTTYPPTTGDSRFLFDLAGEARIVWTFDESRLVADLAGKSKGALQTVLSGYPSIEHAEIVIRPFWKQTFPSAESDIRIRQRVSQ